MALLFVILYPSKDVQQRLIFLHGVYNSHIGLQCIKLVKLESHYTVSVFKLFFFLNIIKRTYFTSVMLNFSESSGSLLPARLSVKNGVPLKPVLGGVRDVALIHYPSCTDTIKPRLQFSCNFVVINASKGSLCFQIFTVFQMNLLW
jgi:hypothetical protein